jgi:hypothetical protein
LIERATAEVNERIELGRIGLVWTVNRSSVPASVPTKGFPVDAREAEGSTPTPLRFGWSGVEVGRGS